MQPNQENTSRPSPAGQSLALRCGEFVRPPTPLTSEEILILKVAELTLQRDFVDSAVRNLLNGARHAGRSLFQRVVLLDDLQELRRRADDAKAVKWPVLPNVEMRDEPNGETKL